MVYGAALFMLLSIPMPLYSTDLVTKKNKIDPIETTRTPQANFALGEHFLLGDDEQPPDYEQAHSYFEKALVQETDLVVKAQAALQLGMLHYFKQVRATDSQKMTYYLDSASATAYWQNGLHEILSLVQILKEPQPYAIQHVDAEGESPLHRAAKKGHVQVIALLFRLGAKAILESRVVGRTALHHAAACGHTRVIELLLSQGAEIDVSDTRSLTPLHLAATAYKKEALALLLKRGAEQKIENAWGHTAFYTVAKRGLCDLAEMFLDHGASLDEVDDNGWTVLHWAVKEGLIDMVKLLIARGAKVNAWTLLEDTPLHMAYMFYQKDIGKILREHGALCHLRNDKGKIPKECTILDGIDLMRCPHGETSLEEDFQEEAEICSPLTPMVE